MCEWVLFMSCIVLLCTVVFHLFIWQCCFVCAVAFLLRDTDTTVIMQLSRSVLCHAEVIALIDWLIDWMIDWCNWGDHVSATLRSFRFACWRHTSRYFWTNFDHLHLSHFVTHLGTPLKYVTNLGEPPFIFSSTCIHMSLGPSIRYVALFLDQFWLPLPVTLCHTSRDPLKVRHISLPPNF